MIRAFVLAVCLAGPAAADDTAALADRYVALPAVQDFIRDDVMQQMKEQMASSLTSQRALTTPQEQLQVLDMTAAALAGEAEAISRIMAAGLAASHSAEELEAMIAFHGSDIGGAVLRKSGATDRAFYNDLVPHIYTIYADLDARVASELGQSE